MLDQYRRIRREHQGEILFFRLGDFYEMFAEDALEVSRLLNLTLTSRGGQPMCGVPYHSARPYIARLLKLGKKIAVCEQVTEPGKGLIDRKVIEIITPGTAVDEDFLEKGNSNYLACLAGGNAAHNLSFAYIDLSTGEFFAAAFPLERISERIRQELERLQPREIILQESLLKENQKLAAALDGRNSLVINRWADWLFDADRSRERLEKQFSTHNLKGFGLSEIEIIAAGALLDYLDTTAGNLIPHVRSISVLSGLEFAGMDEATQKNLELTRNLQDGESNFTLLDVMDETKTSMGKRLLKTRLLQPLLDMKKIQARFDFVGTLYKNQEILSRIREILGKTPDLQRLCSRIAMDKAHGKDIAAVKNALAAFESLENAIQNMELVFESEQNLTIAENAELCKKLAGLRRLLEESLAEEPSILLTEGNLIRQGYDAELDRLHTLRDSGRKTLENYLDKEKEETGIASLKIRYNRMIGYYLEVNNQHLSKVPSHFIRRQGLAGGERFSTGRLAELESEINGASDRIVELEKKLFLEIREKAKGLLAELSESARRIAELDKAQSLARAAAIHGWVRPRVDMENRIRIVEGRHPVVEAHLSRGEFIPNDIILDARQDGTPFALITGPNMAGKSTYLRQAALSVVMAQSGSFVPAREAEIGICDKIFCRVGAMDNLARGESTFLVEMNETASILHTATVRSLVIMDEVGRGTGTADGLSIAWAVSEDLLDRVQCRTLFATHYHELAQIQHSRMANRSMDVKETNDEIVFLRKIKEGPAARSYGIHVARLAGLPEAVLLRAEEILLELEETAGKTRPEITSVSKNRLKNTIPDPKAQTLLKELAEIVPDDMTPLEALKLISEWKARLVFSGKHQEDKRENVHSSGKIPGLFD